MQEKATNFEAPVRLVLTAQARNEVVKEMMVESKAKIFLYENFLN